MQEKRRRDGGLSQHAFGGQFGRKGIEMFSRKEEQYSEDKYKLPRFNYIWCKQVVIGNSEDVSNAIDWM